MKLLKIFMAASLLIFAISCKKSQIAAVTPTSDDAAILLAGSLANNNYGMTNLSMDISNTASPSGNNILACGSTIIDSIVRKNTPGNAGSYNYKVKYNNQVFCNNNSIPDYLINKANYNGNYQGPKLKVTSSGSTNYRVGGLTPTSTVHVINGEYKSTTNFKFRSDTTNSGTVNILIAAKDLILSKTNHTIQSGTAMVIITGNSTKKSMFTYNGNLSFNNAASATLKLNGNEYSIDLLTGEAVKN